MTNIYGFWISPEGTIHTVFNEFGHKEFIEKLLNKKVENEEEEENSLFDDGWIRIVNMRDSLMVNYRCITSNRQIHAIEKIENKLNEYGIFHTQFILDYGYDYHFFDTLEDMIRRIRERL